MNYVGSISRVRSPGNDKEILYKTGTDNLNNIHERLNKTYKRLCEVYRAGILIFSIEESAEENLPYPGPRSSTEQSVEQPLYGTSLVNAQGTSLVYAQDNCIWKLKNEP